jgi:PAS domain S-box-containing protein
MASVHPDDAEAMLAQVHAGLAGGKPYAGEHRIIRPDGTERVVFEESDIIRDAVGRPVKVVGTIQDITERKRDQEALLQNERQFRAVFDNTLDGIAILDDEGTFLEVNSAVCCIYETRREELLGKKFRDFAPPEWNREQVYADMVRAGFKKGELQLVLPSGHRPFIEFSATRQFLPGRNLVALREITERKQIECAIRASEARYRSLFESNPHPMWVYDSQTLAFLAVNDAAVEHYGYSRDEFLAMTLADIRPASEIEKLRAASCRPGPHNGRQGIWKHCKKDGAIIRVEISTHEISFAERPARLVLAHDVTARLEAEAAQARLVSILEATPDFVGMSNIQGHPSFLNRAGREMLGVGEDEDISLLSIAENFTPESQPIHREGLAIAIRDGAWSGETTLVSRCGQTIPLSQVIISHKTSAGELEYISTVGRDISAQKKAEARLQQANDELEERVMERTASLEQTNAELLLQKTILESQGEASFDGIMVVSAQGQIMSYNRRFTEMWNISPQVVENESDETTLQAVMDQLEDAPAFLDKVMYLYKHRDEVSQEEITLKGGRTFDRYSAPVKGTDGVYYGRIWFFRDITERKQNEEALRQARDEADQANFAKSEFLSRMSHELRTPLNGILGFGQILAKRDLDPRAQESVGHILKAGRHLLDLINEVLDIARVEAGRLNLSLEPIELPEIIQEVCALMNPLALERDIHLLETVSLMDAHHVLADRQRLKQVLINLLSNAIKYNHDGGEVEVSCEIQPAGRTRISIRDNGMGIAPQDLTRLFTPFERLHAANSTIEGTGLGLALSQRMVEAMGGELRVESTLGEGTTFFLEFPQVESPLAVSTPVLAARAEEKRVEPLDRNFSVLCIEDNPANLALIEAIFEERPEIHLLTALQGSIGLDLARQHNPDLILLDLNLPDFHGSEVLTKLRQSALTRSIPVVVISADATPNQIERLLSAGARGYLTKPLNVGEFLATLDKLLLVASPESSTI